MGNLNPPCLLFALQPGQKKNGSQGDLRIKVLKTSKPGSLDGCVGLAELGAIINPLPGLSVARSSPGYGQAQ
jgi:hypothetical protein